MALCKTFHAGVCLLAAILLAACGGGGGGGADFVSLTLDGETVTYTESGLDPVIVGSFVAGYTSVFLSANDSGGGFYTTTFQISVPGENTGDFPVDLSAGAIVTFADTVAGVTYLGSAGTLTLDALGSEGGTISGEIPDLTFEDFFGVEPDVSGSVTFSATREI